MMLLRAFDTTVSVAQHQQKKLLDGQLQATSVSGMFSRFMDASKPL